MNKVVVVEKCLVLDANMPKWEVYVDGKLVTTVTEERYLKAVVNYYQNPQDMWKQV